jgi:hypothetical protein
MPRFNVGFVDHEGGLEPVGVTALWPNVRSILRRNRFPLSCVIVAFSSLWRLFVLTAWGHPCMQLGGDVDAQGILSLGSQLGGWGTPSPRRWGQGG